MMLSLANKITVQFDRYKKYYPFFLRHKIVSIHNPVTPVSLTANPEGIEGEKKILLCVARLAYQKNIDVLIKAFAALAPDFPEWILRIAGDGDDEKKLQDKIEALHLTPQVELLGAVKNTEELYCTSHLFCITSRYEGFPNALAESLSYGLPAVGDQVCCGGRALFLDG